MNSIHFKSDQYIEVVSEVISVFAGFKVQTLCYMAVQMQ